MYGVYIMYYISGYGLRTQVSANISYYRGVCLFKLED